MMTELFTRQGEQHTSVFARDTKGAAYFTRPKICGRCGGAGRADKWAFTGYVCFDCNGERYRGTEVVKLYTADRLAKLNATKAKADARRQVAREAKAAAERAASEARANDFRTSCATLIARAAPHMENEFIGDVMRRALTRNEISGPQAMAVFVAIERIETQARDRAASRHVGKVGDRLALVVTVERVFYFERKCFNAHWEMETVWIVTMRDEAGNAIVSKSTRFHPEKGAALKIKATVKEHSIYKDEQQTLVQRIKEAA